MTSGERFASDQRPVCGRETGHRAALESARPGALVLALLFLAACADPIVGAECEPGFHLCDGRCVNLSSFEHCGACDNHCGSLMCIEGECSTVLRQDADADAATSDEQPDGALPLDAGLSGCSLGERQCDDGCVRIDTDRNHCGECGNRCRPNEYCVQGACEEACEEPLVLCGQQCFDIETDPLNCGGCGRTCVSGICESGACADATPGHLVVIGHDLDRARPVMQRIAGNAVFLARGSPVRVLMYERYATDAAIAGTRGAIDYVAQADGRPWDSTTGIEGLVTYQLGEADVFVVCAQRNARNSVLRKLGEQWGNALLGFLRRGGVVVAFEVLGDNAGTYQVLQPGQMFSAEAIGAAAGTTLAVTDPSDQIALGVQQRYVTGGAAVAFESISTPANVVAEDEEAQPVILHRVVTQ